MARVLLAWELGGGLGHLYSLTRFARALRARGHQTCFVVRDLSRAAEVSRPGDDALWFQAPLWLPRRRDAQPAATYADLLGETGFGDAAGLLGLVGGWRALFAAIQPDLLVADHAPVSLLSARGADFAKATLGIGFFVPPPLRPLPTFRTWDPPQEARQLSSEAQALASANQVLASIGQPPMAALHDLFDVDEHWLASWPALDHYPERPADSVVFVGPVVEEGSGVAPGWPAGDGPRWLAYLKADDPAVGPLLSVLARAPVRTLAYVTGLGEDDQRRLASPSLTFSKGAIQIGRALLEADAVVNHASFGVVSAALAAGRPQLMLPSSAEQKGTALRVASFGAGVLIDRERPAVGQVERAVQQLLEDTRLAECARRFAATQTLPPVRGAVDRIVERAEWLLMRRGRSVSRS
jgi:hypothetical protein